MLRASPKVYTPKVKQQFANTEWQPLKDPRWQEVFGKIRQMDMASHVRAKK